MESQTIGPAAPTPCPSTHSDLILQSLTPDEIRTVIRRLERTIAEKEGSSAPGAPRGGHPIEIPPTIFSTRLAPAESLVKFLKEERGMTYHTIGESIHRDERGIWGTYRRATRKMPGQPIHEMIDPARKEAAGIPLSAFSDRNKSILQAVVENLRSRGMRICEIARLLKKSYSTISTTLRKTNLNAKLKNKHPRPIGRESNIDRRRARNRENLSRGEDR